MSKRLPFSLPKDRNGNIVYKFLDSYEYVRGWTDSDPRYFGYMHPDGAFVITRIASDVSLGEHVTFYKSSDDEMLTDTAWGNRATLTYREYSEVF